MTKFDLSALNEADKQELIIRMLVDFHSVIQMWTDRDTKRQLDEASTTDQRKEIHMKLRQDYVAARARIMEAYGLTELLGS
ncbi:hypothetical protein GO988_02515 [Hymenobacter sp. HMF4947]|uniref:Uncharacterized protein n=1 Tax=Hymenobacter ginkgonis TaxID=2682976 RepID=A0A7K1T9V8_9BACT|nr:hypothetical protein [Hymenobacter ginkgonis]MVN75189.1 hypothetical protein [Hymenobacter ginkgonis]